MVAVSKQPSVIFIDEVCSSLCKIPVYVLHVQYLYLMVIKKKSSWENIQPLLVVLLPIKFTLPNPPLLNISLVLIPKCKEEKKF